MAATNQEGLVNTDIDNEGLGNSVIEIKGRGALSTAATLDLGGLAAKHTTRKPLSGRDSAIMENALKKLRNR